jgi:hypothetical protein
MSSTTANAATSTFLKLPPEIRSCIYDCVFGSNSILIKPYLHVERTPKRVGYKISMCTCELDHTQLSPRVRGYDRETTPEKVCTKPCQNCTASAGSRPSAFESLSLPSLQVCRQIYHEAALKPFQQALFIFNFGKLRMHLAGSLLAGYALPAFMNALVPAQVKAITRLRLVSAGRTDLDIVKLPRLQGLKHLEMQLDLKITDLNYTFRRLEVVAARPQVASLAKLNLKSIRVEMGLAELRGKSVGVALRDNFQFAYYR